MAKSLDDLINDLDKIEKAVIAGLSDVVTEMGTSALALSVNQLHKKGIPGKKYSTREMYVSQSVFNNKGAFKPGGKRGFKGERLVPAGVGPDGVKKYKLVKIKPKSMYLSGGYAQLRRIQGLQTSFVDGTYSGRMIQNTKPLYVKKYSDFRQASVIGGVDAETKKKLDGNFKRYGDFLKIPEEFIDAVNEIPINRIAEIITKATQ